MKKIIVAILIVLVWPYCGGLISGQGKDEKGGEQEQSIKSQENDAGKKVDTKEGAGPSGQMRRRKQQEMQRKARQKILEARRRELSRYKADWRGDEPGAKPGKGADLKQQLSTLEKQMAKEEAKHSSRMARLKRIEELATQEGSTKVVGRVSDLIRKERRRFRDKQRYLHGRMRGHIEGESRMGGPGHGERFRPRAPRPFEEADYVRRGQSRGDVNEPSRGESTK